MITSRSVKNQKEIVEALANLLIGTLKNGKRLLWFVSGGSSIPVAVEVSHKLIGNNLSNLFITLVDDKFGLPAAETNFGQLQSEGFASSNATMHNILQPSSSLKQTGERFDKLLKERLAWADIAIGQFGLGEGYHTGGIMAGSPAARARKLAIGYEYQGQGKVTVTPVLIKRLDVAFINSMGEGKRPLVRHFLQSTASVTAEPTQSLKTTKQTFLYSDVL
ncbi:MAG TPA: 6-phosphogluconolactonase [Candidatus Saccharimonadales bacterium]|nr:6-phosphogluconolactonase [Candidatus Saccharimonadales bacterium]